MLKMECDLCKYQSDIPDDFVRITLKRYKSFSRREEYGMFGAEENRDICHACGQKIFRFDIKAPVTDETDIGDLDLSVRAYNCLKRANYATYGDIKNLTVEDGMKIRNSGKRTLDEIIAKIRYIEHIKEQSNES